MKAITIPKVVLYFLLLLYVIYVVNNIVWFVFPLVLNYMDVNCTSAFQYYKMISSYYFIAFSYLQGNIVVLITHYFLKGIELGDNLEQSGMTESEREIAESQQLYPKVSVVNSQIDSSADLVMPISELN